MKRSERTRNDFEHIIEQERSGESTDWEAVYTLVSSQDDWDRYEGLQWYAADLGE